MHIKGLHRLPNNGGFYFMLFFKATNVGNFKKKIIDIMSVIIKDD